MRGTVRTAGVAALTAALIPLSCNHNGRSNQKRRSAASHPSAERNATLPSTPAAAPSGAAPRPFPSTRVAGAPPGDTVVSPEAGPALPGRTGGCPDGMLRVEGEYCPAPLEECVKYNPDYERHPDDKNIAARCLEFRKPSRCLSRQREHLAFCMDRYEYPDKVGEMPWVLTSWLQARVLCKREGKRLCTEDEFNFACEGPTMKPYATGFRRDAKACNIDKPYVMPDHKHRMLPYTDCQKDPRCSAELKHLDQRHAIGAVNTCMSWAGVIDLNGNVNEWVTRAGEKPPHRGGLKGGWWGPVRDRCRPTVIFHKEFDYGYEAGFRCCKDMQDLDAGSAVDASAAPHADR